MNWLGVLYFLPGLVMGIEIVLCMKKYGGKENED